MESRRILIVEDEFITATDLKTNLEGIGYTVSGIARTGEEAVQLAEQDPPDLVLMDIKLGSPMDGIETAEILRAGTGVPVVYLTAHFDNEFLERAKSTEPYGYLVKPCNPIQVSTTVGLALHKARLEKRLADSEAKYRAIVEDQTELICRFAPDCTLTFVNGAYARYWERKPEEMIGTSFLDLIPETARGSAISHLESFSRDEPTKMMVHEVLGPGGDVRWQQWSDRAFFNEKGEFLEFQSVGMDVTDRVKAERALRESEEKYRFIAENMLDIVWIVGPDLSTTYVSPSIEKVLGFTPEDRKQQAPEEIMTPESYREVMERLAEEIQRDQEGGADPDRSVIVDAEYYCKDGSTVWMESRVQAIRDAENRLMGMFGVSRDITERKHHQSVLQAERDMGAAWSAAKSLKERLEICLRTAIQIASLDGGGIYVLDETDGSLTLRVHQGLSKGFVREVSCFSEDSRNARLVRQGVPTYIMTEDLPEARRNVLLSEGIKGLAIVPLVFEGRSVGSLNIASRSMHTIPEHARAALERIGRYASSFVAQEIQEEKIRQSQRDLDTLFNTVQDMLFILDGEGKIVHHNTIVTEKLGYAADQLIGKPVLFVHAEDRHEEARTVIASMLVGEIDTCAIPVKTRDGRRIPVETKVVRGHWRGRDVIIGICRDISERVELERRLRQVEKAEGLGRMAGAIAHHFNNQLQAVMGHLELAIGDLPRGAGPVESMTEAMKAAHRAARVSGLMLTYLGQTVSTRSPMDLSETCRLGLPLIEAAIPKHVLLETDLAAPGPAIRANAQQMQEVVTHLVTNAWEAMAEGGGTIHLSVKAVAAEDIPPTHRFPIGWQPKEKGYACLEVRDTGPGISGQDMEKLFDPFFSTKFTGRGLGLPVVLGIVRAHGGCITAESRAGVKDGGQGPGVGSLGPDDRGRRSEVGDQRSENLSDLASLREKPVGSVFRVFLPLIEGEVLRPKEKPVAVSDGPQGGGTVLLVEDTELVRNLGVRMLQRLGFTVLAAKDGLEGVAVFRDHRDEIRFVLSDLTMPRMDGWATIAALREIDPNVRIILASGYDEATVMSGDHAEQPQVFLAKPYSLEELRAAIGRVTAAKTKAI
ncbi:MAG: PAS domain S-box protein [Candidatus Omnitrophota bacterium]